MRYSIQLGLVAIHGDCPEVYAEFGQSIGGDRLRRDVVVRETLITGEVVEVVSSHGDSSALMDVVRVKDGGRGRCWKMASAPP